jgi:hypothetical protein
VRHALIIVAALLAMSTAHAQQAQYQFTSCSQVAAFSKQQCGSTYRPVICQNNIEQERLRCLQTGEYRGTTVGKHANLRKE